MGAARKKSSILRREEGKTFPGKYMQKQQLAHKTILKQTPSPSTAGKKVNK